MATQEVPATPIAEDSIVYIVYTFTPEGVEPEDHHLRTLASVVGSEEAAKEALLYSYKTVANGFSAKLTKKQAEEMSKRPDVLQVIESKTYQLLSGGTSSLAI